MITKIVSATTLVSALADEMIAVCPAGTVGLVMKNDELRRAVAKEFAARGLISTYRGRDSEPFPEYMRFAVAEGGLSEIALAEDGDTKRKIFLIPEEILPELYLPDALEKYKAVFFLKEDVEARMESLAVTGVKTLLLMFLSAADTAMVSVSDVSGEDAKVFSFLRSAMEFFAEPPVRQNYIARLLAIIEAGREMFCAPLNRFAPLAHGANESGVAMIFFIAELLQRTARLPFLELLTLGVRSQQELYFLEEGREELLFRVFGEKSLKKLARHLRLLLGKYVLQDVALEKGYELLRSAVRESDHGYLSSLKREGVLSAFVKYPL